MFTPQPASISAALGCVWLAAVGTVCAFTAVVITVTSVGCRADYGAEVNSVLKVRAGDVLCV